MLRRSAFDGVAGPGALRLPHAHRTRTSTCDRLHRVTAATRSLPAPHPTCQSTPRGLERHQRGRRELTLRMHAHGDADDLKIAYQRSALAQDDVFLLLTVGLTRAEPIRRNRPASAKVSRSSARHASAVRTGPSPTPVPRDRRIPLRQLVFIPPWPHDPTVHHRQTPDRVVCVRTSPPAWLSARGAVATWSGGSARASTSKAPTTTSTDFELAFGNLGADVRWRLVRMSIEPHEVRLAFRRGRVIEGHPCEFD